MAARMAAKMGYTNIRVYHAGAPAWVKAGYPLITTYDFVSKRMGYLVIIDTRGPEAAKKGHIQGAVAIARDQVIKQKHQFPVDKKAYIVLYSEDTQYKQLAPIAKEIISWGFSRVFILDGGYKKWIQNGGPIQSGLVRTKIFYLPRPHPGEITGDEFVNIVRHRPPDKLILDVRTRAEASAGMIKGAINIPVDELSSRLNELPRDKEIITHCRTGLRAEMAYNILRNAGFKARFLNDKVDIIQGKMYCCYK